jgi:hypothetical protein
MKKLLLLLEPRKKRPQQVLDADYWQRMGKRQAAMFMVENGINVETNLKKLLG